MSGSLTRAALEDRTRKGQGHRNEQEGEALAGSEAVQGSPSSELTRCKGHSRPGAGDCEESSSAAGPFSCRLSSCHLAWPVPAEKTQKRGPQPQRHRARQWSSGASSYILLSRLMFF